MSAIQAIFLIVSFLGVLMALGTVLARNLVHAALFLVAFFFVVACQYVLLEAEFLAAMQVLVYIGAVSILLLFGIMLTRNVQGDETTDARWFTRLPAFLVAGVVLGILVLGILRENGRPGAPPWTQVKTRPGGVNPDPEGPEAERAARINNMPTAIGDELMTRDLVPFELAGLLLTAAVIGAIALARQDRAESPSRPSGPGLSASVAEVEPETSII